MIDTYDKLIEEKEEIECMIELINKSNTFNTESSINKIRAIIKYTLIFKRLDEFKEQNHYSKSMISDLILMINSLSQNSIKVYYTFYRSFIENFIRFVLEIKDEDSTGVRALFTSLKKEYYSEETKDMIDFIEGEYGKGCDFIHSNINADQKIFEYYNELINEDKFKDEDINRLSSVILTFMKKATLLLVHIKTGWIDEAFYKKKQLFKYLVNANTYECLKERIQNI